MRTGWLLMILLSVSCTKANPAATCSNGSCTDPAFPFCDVDGSVGGEPGTCVAVSCTPGDIKECHGDMAFTCSPDGAGYHDVPCDLGCGDLPSPHCRYLQPKYLPTICDSPATTDLSISSNGALDPNIDTTCTGGVIPQGGSDLCVVRARTIDIASDVSFVGGTSMSTRSIAFVADGMLTVEGTLDAGGHYAVNGPGGGTYVSGGAGGFNNQTGITIAPGGAGGATAGGAGATSKGDGSGTDGGGANGGPATMNPALLASFVGGASGLRPGDVPNTPDPYFGGGGGALMLVSCHDSVVVTGVLNVGGGGGGGGFITSGGIPLPVLPHGGGAGGNIVLQGRNVSVTGQVFANGGGGGEGWQPTTGVAGSNGGDGAKSDSSNTNGGNAFGGAGGGGDGGWVGVPALAGKRPSAMGGGGGAGGGSVGFLQTYTPMGTDPTLTPSHASPKFQPNGTVELR